MDRSDGRLCFGTDDIQQCRLSCTIRTDKKMDIVTPNIDVHIRQGLKSVKYNGYMFDF